MSTKNNESETDLFFQNEREPLLEITSDYKKSILMESVGWQLLQSKYSDMLKPTC